LLQDERWRASTSKGKSKEIEKPRNIFRFDKVEDSERFSNLICIELGDMDESIVPWRRE